MAQPWQVESAKGRCAVTGRPLAEGEPFHSALFEEGETFRRVDYSVDAWTGPPEGCFCYFKSKVPIREKRRKQFVDDEMLVSFFRRLESETEPVRVQFRFVLALILMRKRLLRYDGSTVENGAEVWQMRLHRDQTDQRVVNPRLTEDQIEGASRQLSEILHSDMGEWTDEAETDAAAAGDRVADAAN